jgi:hypothetical protein
VVPGSKVTIDGAGVIGHAEAALPRELADQLELASRLGWRVPSGGRRNRHPGHGGAAGSGGHDDRWWDRLSDLAVFCRTWRVSNGPGSPRPTSPSTSTLASWSAHWQQMPFPSLPVLLDTE